MAPKYSVTIWVGSPKHRKGPKSHNGWESLDLQAVLLLQGLLLLPEGVDTVNHGLDEGDLGVSQPVLVGHVVGAAIEATRLSAGSTGLDCELLAPLLQGVKTLLCVSGQVNHDGGPHAGSEVGGAGVDVAELLGKGKVLAGFSLDGVSDSLDATGKTGEDSLDVAALLHGDDSHLVLLVHPQEEGLGLVVEDSTALGPVALHAGNDEVAVTGDEQEVVVDQLLAGLLIHASQGVVGSGEVTGQLGEGALQQALNTQPLLLGDARGQTEAINGTSNPDTGGVDGHLGVDVALDLVDVHVGGVLGVSRDAMVLLDEGVEDLGEVLVAIPVSGVDAAVLVVELDGALTARLEGAAGSLGGDVLQFVPLLLGHVLGDQGVGGQDGGEFAGHDVTLWTSCRSESSNKSLVLAVLVV